ncbi:MAG: hypothetical protein CVU64_22565 [Deltaproteobacteria bacterium HGW-Deltaproteobacteria-21]|nr:MAG: hypothetical protein CVU64_22565 [Deltaproteobacteria bacterium HGW-Deltaproteobacteria-21]
MHRFPVIWKGRNDTKGQGNEMAGKMSRKGMMTRGRLERTTQFDSSKTFQSVVVLPTYGGNPDCNKEFCAVLFTDRNAGLYVPRVESRGPGAPRNYDLSGLWAYHVSDGSLLFAAPGSNPTEYGSGTGAIRIEFQTGIGPAQDRRETGGGFWGN